MTLSQINRCDREHFVACLGSIFEHSPWVAALAFEQQPFADLAALHAAMCNAFRNAPEEAQLALIRAHPQLAGKAAVRGEITASSSFEQSSAGLDRCSPEEFERIHTLNDAYFERFEFPFILAVRGHTRSSIIANMAERLPRGRDDEFAEALNQIERIARFRLNDMFKEYPP